LGSPNFNIQSLSLKFALSPIFRLDVSYPKSSRISSQLPFHFELPDGDGIPKNRSRQAIVLIEAVIEGDIKDIFHEMYRLSQW
jgi:hypothetical protein